MGKNFFLDETCPVRDFVSVDPVSLDRRTHFRGELEDLVRLFHSDRLRQETLEKTGHRSPTWVVL